MIRIESTGARFLLDDVPISERIEHVPFVRPHLFRFHLRIVRIAALEIIQRLHVVVLRAKDFRDRKIDARTVRSSCRGIVKFVKRPIVRANDVELIGFGNARIFTWSGSFFCNGNSFQIGYRFADLRITWKILRRRATAIQIVESLLRQIAIPVRVVAIEQTLIDRARFRDFAYAFAVARGPVSSLAAKIGIVTGIDCQVFSEQLRRLIEILRFVRLPCNVELCGRNFRHAGKEVHRRAIEVARVDIVFIVLGRLA